MSTATPSPTVTRFSLRISGGLPLHGSRVTIDTDPCRLIRDEIKGAQRQLAEALVAAHGFRLQQATLALVGSDGTLLRATRLVEHPSGDGYAAAELVPGGSTGDPLLWLAGCAKEFGRKRSL